MILDRLIRVQIWLFSVWYGLLVCCISRFGQQQRHGFVVLGLTAVQFTVVQDKVVAITVAGRDDVWLVRPGKLIDHIALPF